MSNTTALQYRLDTIEPGQLGHDEPVGPLSRHEAATRGLVPSHRDVARLVDVVRAGELTSDEREQLASLLDAIGSATRVAPLVAAEMAAAFPRDPRAGEAAALGAWQPVEDGFIRLLSAVLAGVRR